MVAPAAAPLVLSQDREIAQSLEAGGDLAAQLAAAAGAAHSFDRAGCRVVIRLVATFQPDRLLYDCIAIRLPAAAPQKK